MSFLWERGEKVKRLGSYNSLGDNMAKVILKVTQLDDRSLQTEIDLDSSVRPESVGVLLADIARHFERYFERVGRGRP